MKYSLLIMDVIPSFDGRGLLPSGTTGFYLPSLEEFVDRFVSVGNRDKRSALFEKYCALCLKCVNTNALKCHYVDGSYVSTKEEPDDIDLLIIFKGSNIDNIPDKLFAELLSELQDLEEMKKQYSCHTFHALDYNPSDYKELRKYHKAVDLFNLHEGVKNDVIGWWKTNFLDKERKIRDPIEKGVIILSEDEIKKMRSS